jgi:formylglycine-generating enzyme required for sulfatase activity
MKTAVLVAFAVVVAGCGRHGGLGAGNTTPTKTADAAVAGTGGIGAGGNAGATAIAATGGTSVAGSTAASGGTGGVAIGSGGAISLGGSSGSSDGTGGGTTVSGGISSSGGSLNASGGRSGGTTGTGGDSTLGGNSGSIGGQKGGNGGITGGGAVGIGGTSAAGGAAGGCGGCQSLEQCWDGKMCVANSVQVPGHFLIDVTEVTRGQNAAWLATNPTTTRQLAVCAWNTSFAPDATCMALACQGTECANHPQVCIDMCDASAYCNAAGKRLCTGNEWSNACTSNGVNRFTYGNGLVRGTCHDYTDFNNNTTTVPVGSMPGCQSPVPEYAGIFDLIGNVWEWEIDCTGSAGTTDTCKSAGTSFGDGAALPECSQSEGSKPRAGFGPDLGFRCCITLG